MSGRVTADTTIERSMKDRAVLHRTISLWVLCSGVSSLATHLILREWFLVLWSTGLLLLGSYLVSLMWRPGEATQNVQIENWITEVGCPRPESHV